MLPLIILFSSHFYADALYFSADIFCIFLSRFSLPSRLFSPPSLGILPARFQIRFTFDFFSYFAPRVYAPFSRRAPFSLIARYQLFISVFSTSSCRLIYLFADAFTRRRRHCFAASI